MQYIDIQQLFKICESFVDRGKFGLADSVVAAGPIESAMTHISGFERSQILLLPEALDDYVGADNPVRFIDGVCPGRGEGDGPPRVCAT